MYVSDFYFVVVMVSAINKKSADCRKTKANPGNELGKIRNDTEMHHIV